METLLADLVLHDRQPSAFLVYLHLWYRSAGRAAPVRTSHQEMVSATGLSKSAVQGAIRTLVRRRLLRAAREGVTRGAGLYGDASVAKIGAKTSSSGFDSIRSLRHNDR